MASKRKKPSQRLRHEVSEYTSLIRTLHTSSTRDIVPHLVGVFPPPLPPTRHPSKKQQRHSRSRSDSSQNEGHQSSDEFKPVDSSSDSNGDSVKKASRNSKKGEVDPESTDDKESSIEPSARRGIWDRWPLLQQSVHVPEWTLQDEVKAIAEKTMKDWAHSHEGSASANGAAIQGADGRRKGDKSRPDKQREPPVSPGATSEATEEEYWDVTAASVDEGLLSQSALYGLSLEAATFLSHIFGLLAAHRPAYDASLQNRLNATDWKTALNILASSEIISNDNIEAAKATMEQIFGHTDLIPRSRVKPSAMRKLSQIKRTLDDRDDLFSCPTKLPYRKRPRRI